MTDWGRLYLDHVDAVTALAGDLDEEALATTVPATPRWTVKQVLQHLAGGPASALAGRMEGAPGPEWTAVHTAERDGSSVEELIAELRENAEAVARMQGAAERPALVWDIAVHHTDLHEALGKHRLDERYWAPIVSALAPHQAPELVDEIPAYELFRALFSRRSRTQMQSWGVEVDSDRLDEMPIFGPREDDQPVPG